MDLLQIIVLAIVQGVTEFLPVSSSGHLVIVEDWLAHRGPADQQAELTLNIFLHLGTLLAVLVFYFRPIVRLLTEDRRVIGLLLVGTLPAVVVGLSIQKADAGAGDQLAAERLPVAGDGPDSAG